MLGIEYWGKRIDTLRGLVRPWFIKAQKMKQQIERTISNFPTLTSVDELSETQLSMIITITGQSPIGKHITVLREMAKPWFDYAKGTTSNQ